MKSHDSALTQESISARRRGVKHAGWLVMIAGIAVATPGWAAIPDKARAGLESSSQKVRLISIAVVGKSKDAGAAALLLPLLQDDDVLVQAGALDALGVLGDNTGFDAVAAKRKDTEPSVRAAAERAMTALLSSLVLVDTGSVQDYSGAGLPQLTTQLRTLVEKDARSQLGAHARVQRGGVDKGYGVLLALRGVKTTDVGKEHSVTVTCEATVVELPGKVLRLSTKAEATAGIEGGTMTPAVKADLATDGIAACAPSLTEDVVSFLRTRMKS
jgi:hypothetical protein